MGEVRAKPFSFDLEEALDLRDVFQGMAAEIAELDARQALVVDDPRGDLRQQNLTTVRRGTDARGTRDAHPDVTVPVEMGFGRVDPDSDADRPTDREFALRRNRGRDGFCRALKGREERVSLGIDNCPEVRRDHTLEHLTMVSSEIAVRRSMNDENARYPAGPCFPPTA